MKVYLYCFFGFIFCSVNTYAQKDTTYKRGDFLIDVFGKTRIDLIRQGMPLMHKTSKGDTLFENKKYVVLGDDTNITVWGIYKKFRPKHKFSTYSMPIYRGKIARPDFKTNNKAYLFRTQIRDQCKGGINFAGHYTIAEWGCGSGCQEIAIVDRITGKIYYSDESSIINELAYGLKFLPNSRLIIVNTGLLEKHKGYVEVSSLENLEFVEWINNKVRRLPE